MQPPAPDHEPRRGGVLILLYPADDSEDLHLVLTRRTDKVGNHRGQISLPGGRVDPDDLSTARTALREACEEIGVCDDDLRLLGELTPLYIPPSDFTIHPHVAFLHRRPQFHPQPDEVAEVLEVPVSYLLDQNHILEEDWIIRGEVRRVPFYHIHDSKVWGATAMVLAELAAVLEGVGGGESK
jgi:8-oxo-dGTP pyrophosphatase MutT (NUDIX family)